MKEEATPVKYIQDSLRTMNLVVQKATERIENGRGFSESAYNIIAAFGTVCLDIAMKHYPFALEADIQSLASSFESLRTAYKKKI